MTDRDDGNASSDPQLIWQRAGPVSPTTSGRPSVVVAVAVAVFALVATSCADPDDRADSSPSSTTVTSTPTAPLSAPSSVPSTTVTAPSTSSTTSPAGEPTVNPAAGGITRNGPWDGSGCVAGTGALPDGWWAGLVGNTLGVDSNGVPRTGGGMAGLSYGGFEFNLVCFKAKGSVGTSSFDPVLSDDRYQLYDVLVADGERTRTLCAFDPQSDFERYGDLGLGEIPCGVESLDSLWGGLPRLVWVHIVGGTAVEIIEQYPGDRGALRIYD